MGLNPGLKYIVEIHRTGQYETFKVINRIFSKLVVKVVVYFLPAPLIFNPTQNLRNLIILARLLNIRKIGET